jgi:PIN domain nuclease of toxin-antitoxin system
MNILLDTHFLVWAIGDTKKLHKREQELLTDPGNGVFVSVVSIWEISIKSAIGKMEMAPEAVMALPHAIREAGFELIGLEPDEAATFYRLPRTHKDPFDRMLVWQAISRKMSLMTRDKELGAYSSAGLRIIG